MFSGGLDSILASRIMVLEGFEVIALHFYTGFSDTHAREIERGPRGSWEPPPEVADAARRVGARLLPMDVNGPEYLDLITHPKHGYGSAANPCLDCRSWLLGKARGIMEETGAVLVFTGEVVGQRPMSQHKPALRLMIKRSGLEGRLLRPLSALLLEPTIPEMEGIVNRDHLYGFSGRSRHPQQELARTLGIDFYPSSGGGCLLTDPIFGRRFHDLIAHPDSEPSARDFHSLKAGRHLRLPGGLKAVVGRTERENLWLGELFGDEAWAFEACEVPGATVFVLGEPGGEDARLAAAVAAHYGKGRDCDEVTVVARRGEEFREYLVRPASSEEIEPLLIQ
jgi:tRNA-uridine 2-sulfurtransferase